MHKRFCPHKADVDHTECMLEFLLNNKIGVGDSAPVLRARPDSDSDNDSSGGRGESDDDDGIRIFSRALRAPSTGRRSSACHQERALE
jgi:hypothetical protein